MFRDLLIKYKNLFIYSIFFILLFFSIYLRFVDIGRFSLWQDELALFYNSNRSFSSLINYCLNFSFHPPLYYLFIKICSSFLGLSINDLRFFHGLLGILSFFIPIAYYTRTKKNLYFILSVLIASNATLITYSKYALVYSFSLNLVILFFCEYFRCKELDNKRVLYLILVTTLIGYSNYIAFFVVVLFLFFEYLINLFSKENLFKRGILLISPCLLFTVFFIQTHLFYNIFFPKEKIAISWHPPVDFLTSIVESTFFIFNQNILFLLLVLGLIAFSIFKYKRFYYLKYMVYFILFILSLALVFYILKVFQVRYFIFITPFLFLVVSFFICRLNPKERNIFLCFILFSNFMNIEKIDSLKGYQDINPVLRTLGELKPKKNSRINVLTYNYEWYKYYFKDYKNHVRPIALHCDNKISFYNQIQKGDYLITILNQCNPEKLLSFLFLNYRIQVLSSGDVNLYKILSKEEDFQN